MVNVAAIGVAIPASAQNLPRALQPNVTQSFVGRAYQCDGFRSGPIVLYLGVDGLYLQRYSPERGQPRTEMMIGKYERVATKNGVALRRSNSMIYSMTDEKWYGATLSERQLTWNIRQSTQFNEFDLLDTVGDRLASCQQYDSATATVEKWLRDIEKSYQRAAASDSEGQRVAAKLAPLRLYLEGITQKERPKNGAMKVILYHREVTRRASMSWGACSDASKSEGFWYREAEKSYNTLAMTLPDHDLSWSAPVDILRPSFNRLFSSCPQAFTEIR